MPTKKSTRSCAGAPFLILVNSLYYRQPSLWRKKHNQFPPRKGGGLLLSAYLPTKNRRSNFMLFNTKLPQYFSQPLEGPSKSRMAPSKGHTAQKENPWRSSQVAAAQGRRGATNTLAHASAHCTVRPGEDLSITPPTAATRALPPVRFRAFFASISWFVAPFRRWWSGWSHVEVPPQLHSATAKHTGPHSRAPQPPKRLTAARTFAAAWPLRMQ